MWVDPELKETWRKAGERREGRFNSALIKIQERRPWWYLGTTHASVDLDMKGIDFLAHVINWNKKGDRALAVQVKSSQQEFVDYYRKHPYAVGKNIVEMVIPLGDKTSETAGNYLRKLENLWQAGYEHDSYIGELGLMVRDEQHHRVLRREMTEARSTRSLKLPSCAKPPIWVRLCWEFL